MDGARHEGVRAVNANRNDDGWNVNAYSVENRNEWNQGNRVFSAIIGFLPRFAREFCFRVRGSSRRAFYLSRSADPRV